MSARVAIIGAGPAGLMAGIAAAEAGADAIVTEQLDRPAAKLLATGGGRCNFTNMLRPEEFMARFGRQGRFMQPALAGLDPRGLRDFLTGLGLASYVAEGGGVYPVGDRAGDVRDALLGRCRELGVEIRCGVCAEALLFDESLPPGLRGVRTSTKERSAQRPSLVENQEISASAVVIACGGQSYPDLGGTGGGYDLAAQAGHTILQPVAALVALRVREEWLCQCAGVSLQSRVWIDLPGRSRRGQTGDVLITHRGLSGPAVLDLSSEVSELLGRGGRESVPLRLEVCAGVGKAQWKERLEGWRRHEGRRRLEILLAQHLPARLAELFCRQAGCLGTLASQAPADKAQALAEMLSALSLEVSGTEGFASAMVTRGGVSLRQVDPRTLQSRLLRGLFFAGEVLDLDGPCGGYNLQWAFSSGRLAGLSAAHTRDSRPVAL
jgi:hypothetical protein